MFKEFKEFAMKGNIMDGKTIAAIMAYAAAKKGGMGKHLDL